jgi:hypothetical protein
VVIVGIGIIHKETLMGKVLIILAEIGQAQRSYDTNITGGHALGLQNE